MMLRLVIVSVVLSATAVYCGWPCGCDESLVACSVYDFAREYIYSMDSMVVNGNLLISPLSLWMVLSYAVWYTDASKRTVLIMRLYDREHRLCGSGSSIIKRYFKYAAVYTNPQAGDPFNIHTAVYFSQSSQTKDLTKMSIKALGNFLNTVNHFRYFAGDGLQMIRNEHVKEFKHMSKFMSAGDVTYNTQYVILNMLKFNTQWKIPFRSKEIRQKNKRYTMLHANGVFTKAYDRSRDTDYLYLETIRSGMIMVVVLTDSQRTRPNPRWDFFDPKNGIRKRQQIAIPKFTFEAEYNVRQVIQEFNLGVFRADFEVHKAKSKVSQAVQRTVVSIDESGVTFESYTALVGDPTRTARDQVNRNEPYVKPFEFYLFSHKNLVAYGRIMDPTH